MMNLELYRRFPVLCTIWAFLEVLCFGGVIFGWGSLVFVLKEEGFYIRECRASYSTWAANSSLSNSEMLNISNIVITEPYTSGSKPLNDTNYYILNSTDETGTNLSTITDNVGTPIADVRTRTVGCQAQESVLNLWFSIAVSFMYLSFAGIGYVVRRLGTRFTRIIFIFVYMVGLLCLAFATPDVPWLLLPGLCCTGTGGLVILATNLQVANLHPRIRSTVVAIFTGLFDFSSINKQLIKVAYESGIPRRSSYIFTLAAYLVIVTTSTVFFLPKMHITNEESEKSKEKEHSEKEDDVTNPTTGLMEKTQIVNNNGPPNPTSATTPEQQPSLCSSLTSLTCVLHLYWLFVHALRFITFIGLLNVWLEDLFSGDEEKVSSYIGVFSYMTMGAIGTALFCGFLYDWQRKRYLRAGPLKRVYMSVLLPMSLVILYSTLTTVLSYIRYPVTPYLAFVVFTFFRSSLFTVAVAFVGEAFPVDFFGVLFGFIQFAAGLAGLIQYPLFEWYDAYQGSYAHVNILLLVLQLSTIVHPVLLYIRGRKDQDIDMTSPFNHQIAVLESDPL